VLVNAIYLKANWRASSPSRLRRQAVHAADGSRVSVPTMSLTGEQDIPYAKAADGRPRSWDTGRRWFDALAMTLILPDNSRASRRVDPGRAGFDHGGLASERQKLASSRHHDQNGECQTYPYNVALSMPRFGIDTKAELSDALKAMECHSP